MGNKFFTLLAFFIAFAANAQKITEKDLIGEWKLVAVDLYGSHFDCVTDSIFISKEWAEKMPEASTIDLCQKFRTSFSPLKGTITFKTGLKAIWNLENRTDPFYEQYYIVEKEGKYFLQNEYGSKSEIYFISGLLYWRIAPLNDEDGKLIYKKIK